jgi:AcrR family transcriptional regulator
VPELSDRRAQKKAQTRELIRSTAHRMFAEQGFDAVTIADIARGCDVAVQTVFNHFPTKEELFFDGRTPWVSGPADAVRSRDRCVTPLAALRNYLVGIVPHLVSSLATPERRCYMATLQGSNALRARELELIFESEGRLAAALLEAWTTDEGGASDAPPDPATAAPLISAIWLTAARVLIMEKRPMIDAGADPAEVGAALGEFTERLLAQMEAAFAMVVGLPETVRAPVHWPATKARQAG